MSIASTFNSVQDKVSKLLHEKNAVTNVLEIAETKTKVKREYIVYGIIGFLAFYLIVGWGNDFLCNLIGFLYPAYASVKAIESHVTDDDTKWLMYWTCYAFFGILEFFGDQLLFWIPFYSLTKCLFLIWLMVPGKNGGTYLIYNKILKVFVLKHQDRIDSAINKGRDEINKISAKFDGDKDE